MGDIEREIISYTVVCDECGEEFDNARDWLDPSHECMPNRKL